MHERAGTGRLDRIEQLIPLRHIVVADDQAVDLELTRALAEIFDIGIVALRELVHDLAAAGRTLGPLDPERRAPETAVVEIVKPRPQPFDRSEERRVGHAVSTQ